MSGIKDIVSRAKEFKFPAVALTDHGNLYGAIEFYKECKKQGMKHLLGMEAYITSDPDDLSKEKRTRDNHHLILIAQNQEGFKNLIWLTSNAHLHNFYYKPRVSREALASHYKGLIASSACIGSVLGEPFFQDQTSGKDYKAAEWLCNLFEGRFFIELQDPDWGNSSDGRQELYNRRLLQIAQDLKLKTVISSDSHFPCREDLDTHRVMMAIQTKKTLKDYMESGELLLPEVCHIRPPQEMLKAAIRAGNEEAYYNTNLVADMCEDVNPGIGQVRMPSFPYQEEEDYKNGEFQNWLKNRNNN